MLNNRNSPANETREDIPQRKSSTKEKDNDLSLVEDGCK